MRRKFPNIFTGWWIVLATGLTSLVGMGYYQYGISALFKPISSELHISRAATSIASSMGRFEGGFEGLLTGWLTDRYGAKWVICIGILLVTIGLLLMRYVNSLWTFLAFWGVLVAIGCNAYSSIPSDAAISNWFVKKRGLALGVKYVIAGLSGVVTLPIIAWILHTQGWRIACTVGGVVMGLVCLPMAFYLIKSHRPEYYGLLPDGAIVKEETKDKNEMINLGLKYAAEVKETEFTLRQALRTPAFWLLVLCLSLNSFIGPIMSIHCIPFLTDMGIDPVEAAGIMSIYVGISIPFRFIGGIMMDRVKRERLRFIMSGAYLLQAVGFAAFLLNNSIAMIYVWFIFYGAGLGIGFISGALRGRYFGRKAFGSIQGFVGISTMPFAVVGPVYAGWIYDTTGSYITVFIQAAGLLAISSIIMALILPPKPLNEVTDVRKVV